MRAHQIMTRRVLTVVGSSSILQAANIMLKNHVSGLPVVDHTGKLVGIVSQGDLSAAQRLGPNESALAGLKSSSDRELLHPISFMKADGRSRRS